MVNNHDKSNPVHHKVSTRPRKNFDITWLCLWQPMSAVVKINHKVLRGYFDGKILSSKLSKSQVTFEKMIRKFFTKYGPSKKMIILLLFSINHRVSMN